MKFNKLIKIYEEEIFKAASKDEIKNRQKKAWELMKEKLKTFKLDTELFISMYGAEIKLKNPVNYNKLITVLNKNKIKYKVENAKYLKGTDGKPAKIFIFDYSINSDYQFEDPIVEDILIPLINETVDFSIEETFETFIQQLIDCDGHYPDDYTIYDPDRHEYGP